jgi:hypothetical protein
LANANAGTPLNPNLTTQQLWNEFYQIITQPKSDIESIIANQLMKFLYAPPAPGGVGANGQVIFNDGGVLAGDPQFLWNKTTNLLTVTGSATITGDLTVDTSTLKVTASTDTVTVGATTTDAKFRVIDANYNGIRIGFLPGTLNYNLYDATVHEFRTANVTPQQLYTLQASSSVWYDGAGGTRMTLNSTGLGVGVVPSLYRFEVGSGSTDTRALFTSNNAFSIGVKNGANQLGGWIGSAGNNILTFSGNDGTMKVTIDNPGNVGVGVTPSAWSANSKALQLGSIGTVENFNNADFNLGSNYYRTSGGTLAYSTTKFATAYSQSAANGTHAWLTAASGTAGNAASFTQAMTLDASGNLLVGKSSSVATAVGIQFQPLGTSYHTLSASTNSDSTLLVYSTGAAAFRFYVGLAGTVFATNTTISAISDARLKENVQDLDVGLDAILALKPRKFDWKAGKGKDIKGDRGFIAQEFEQVFPNLIDEWKDPAPEGEAPYKSVRQDLIPVLVKAIQELTARVEALEA